MHWVSMLMVYKCTLVVLLLVLLLVDTASVVISRWIGIAEVTLVALLVLHQNICFIAGSVRFHVSKTISYPMWSYIL
jgi:hypothetical protein